MANDTQICVVGNLTADPDLRYTQSGTAVASFTIASTPRTYDKASGQFKDGETLFLRCSIWRDYAEHVAESLRKGMQVIAQGKLVQKSWEKDGQKRTSVELQVDEVGPTLRWVTVEVQRAQNRGQASAPGAPSPVPVPTTGPTGNGGQADPWATPGQASFDSEPPF